MIYEYEKYYIEFCVCLDPKTNRVLDDYFLVLDYNKSKIINSHFLSKDNANVKTKIKYNNKVILKKIDDDFVILGGLGKPEQIEDKEIYKIFLGEDDFIEFESYNYTSMDVFLLPGMSELIENLLKAKIKPADYMNVDKTLSTFIGIVNKIKDKYKLEEKLD